MKWGALCLLLVNVVFWFAAGALTDHLRPREAAHGRLPRVAPIEMVGQADAAPASEPASRVSPIPPKLHAESAAGQSAEACLIVGWFDSPSEARGAAKQTGRIPEGATVRSVSLPAQPYHWVILPPAKSREAALRRLAEIQQQGIDSYLVTEGVHANAISLGLFESLEAAEAVLSRSQSHGLEAMLATFPRNRIRYALVFQAQFQDAKDSLSQTRRELEHRFRSVTFGRCEGVATTQKNP